VYNERYGTPLSPRFLRQVDEKDLLQEVLAHISDEDVADEASDWANDAQEQVNWAEGVSFDPDDTNVLVVPAMQAFNWYTKALVNIMHSRLAAGLCDADVQRRFRELKLGVASSGRRALLRKVADDVRVSLSSIDADVQFMLLQLELLGGLELALIVRDSKCKGVCFPPPPRTKCICLTADFVPYGGYDFGVQWGLRADPHFACSSKQPALDCVRSACGKGTSDVSGDFNRADSCLLLRRAKDLDVLTAPLRGGRPFSEAVSRATAEQGSHEHNDKRSEHNVEQGYDTAPKGRHAKRRAKKAQKEGGSGDAPRNDVMDACCGAHY